MISVSSSFVDPDAYTLVASVLDMDPATAVISTRETGDDPFTDTMLARLRSEYPHAPLIEYSAKTHGRLDRTGEEAREAYDGAIFAHLQDRLGKLPELNVMVGDMIIKGPTWCRDLPSLNLHPDLPRGFKGIYWEVIAQRILANSREFGGMMHGIIPKLDAGPPVSYFRLPARGIVNGVNLGPLWDALPQDPEALERLIGEQVALKDKPTNPLFQELRRAEASFEQRLVLETLKAFDAEGSLPIDCLDVTDIVVGESAVWPGIEGKRGGHERF